MIGKRIPKIIQSSTIAFFKEGRRSPKVSLPDLLHGYIYARWPYLYIGTGLGNTRLARVSAPVLRGLGRITRFSRRLIPRPQGQTPPESSPPRSRKTFADNYHGKVVTLSSAKQLVSLKQEIALENLEHVVPFEKARDIVMHDPDHIAVLECPCRASRANPCYPLDVCLIVGEPFASFILEHQPDRARAITSKEAVAILEAEHERGHVHHAFFKDAMLGRFYAICNCCACCCGAMQATRNGIPMIIPSGYISSVDEALCVGCGACIETCQFGALTLGYGYTIVVDAERCMGCGVCVGQCDFEAMSLQLAPERGAPLEMDALMAG